MLSSFHSEILAIDITLPRSKSVEQVYYFLILLTTLNCLS